MGHKVLFQKIFFLFHISSNRESSSGQHCSIFGPAENINDNHAQGQLGGNQKEK